LRAEFRIRPSRPRRLAKRGGFAASITEPTRIGGRVLAAIKTMDAALFLPSDPALIVMLSQAVG
jgi:hypothetical protein